ncbi:MAG TPA: ORF6N domain-containing protein, partial [Desulfomonilaceae bacterium]|nr:ORF6N domain-containing protein [Desulfomonilaceae bacterium]
MSGVKVIIDADLEEFYGVPTRRLNEQVKRNRERFPEDFMFQLTTAAVLNSARAIDVSIFVVRTFVELRQAISGHRELAP